MYQSNALWPPGVCASMWGDDISTDTHSTKEQAEGVCSGLKREGFGGERKVFPIYTWVSDIEIPPKPPEEAVRASFNLTVVKMWNDMRRSGMPKEHLQQLVNYHIKGLQALPETIAFRDLHIKFSKEFLTNLNKEVYNVSDARSNGTL